MNALTISKDTTAVLDHTVRTERKRRLDFIRKRVRNQSDAEDILQDVFEQLAATDSVTDPIEHLTGWLFTTARNRIIDWYRKRRPGRSAPLVSNADPLFLEEILFDPRQDPDELYARSLVWRELADALDELPEEQREVFVLQELDGMTFREISEATGVPLNTLLSRKRYAVLKLRERLADLYDELRTLSENPS